MDKKLTKEMIILALLTIFALIMPFFVFMLFPPFMLSFWISGLLILSLTKRKNPDVINTKRYQLFEKLLYFQMINWAFAYFIFILELQLIAWLILIVLFVLSLKKERRTNARFTRWVKYVGFHLYNLALILVLLNHFPDVGGGAFVTIPLITFFNGLTAATYLTLIKKAPSRNRTRLTLIIILIMMAGTVVSLFPQATGVSVIELILGGR